MVYEDLLDPEAEVSVGLVSRRKGEVPYIHAALFASRPEIQKSFPRVAESLISNGELFVPEHVSVTNDNGTRVIQFQSNKLPQLISEWESETLPGVWHLGRRHPIIDVTYVREPSLFYLDARPFGSVSLDLARSYFDNPNKLDQFLKVFKELCGVLRASYGFVKTHEMGRHLDKQGKEYGVAIDLKRALPDIYWANFFGSEYVEMFGDDKIKSAPSYRVETLAGGGALLTLTSSPFDFDTDKTGFENRRIQLKQYLGTEAFDPSDWNPFETPHWIPRGKTPNFRLSLEGGTSGIAVTQGPTHYSDMLSVASRGEWDEWLRNNQALATELVSDMEAEGLNLDFSGESLAGLDKYLANSGSRNRSSIAFLKKLAAYLAQVVIRNTSAAWSWSFEDSVDLPELRVGHIRLSPLARTQKILLEGETFQHWYEHLVKDIAS